MASVNLDVLNYKLDSIIEQFEKNCRKMEEIYSEHERRIACLEKKWSWGKGLLAGMGVVTFATLIKLFFNIP